MMINCYNPGGIFTPTSSNYGNIGNILLCIGGKGAFQSPQIIQTVTGSDELTVIPGWDYGNTPDATTTFVVVEQAPQVMSQPYSTSVPGTSLMGQMQIPTYGGMVVRIEGYLATNIVSLEQAAFRELYCFGGQATRNLTGISGGISYLWLVTDNTLLCNDAAGNIVYTCLPAALIPNQTMTWRKTVTSTNTTTVYSYPGGSTPPVAGYTQAEAFGDGTTSKVLTTIGDSFSATFDGNSSF
jgi:hypothetical protein